MGQTVNGAVKIYADALYEQARSSSGQTLHAEKANFVHLMASRRNTSYQPLSGPECQSVTQIFADHVSRCIIDLCINNGIV